VPSLPSVSDCNCGGCPLRERIPRALHVQCRLFLRRRLCQWLSQRMMVLPTHNGPFPPLTASTSENHCSRKPSTDFCNKICHDQTTPLDPDADRFHCATIRSRSVWSTIRPLRVRPPSSSSRHHRIELNRGRIGPELHILRLLFLFSFRFRFCHRGPWGCSGHGRGCVGA
jgi:hypothetical protein